MNNGLIILQKIKKISIISAIALLSVGALMAIIGIIALDMITLPLVRIWGTISTLGIFIAIMVRILPWLSSKKTYLKIFAWLILIPGTIATLLFILSMWGAFDKNCYSKYDYNYYYYGTSSYSSCYLEQQKLVTTLNKVYVTCIALAATLVICGFYLNKKAENLAISIFRTGTIATSIATGILVIIGVLFEISSEDFMRLVIAMGILLILGLIATPTLALSLRNHDSESDDPSHQTDIAALRTQIEQEIRAKIAAEQAESAVAAPNSTNPTENTPAPSEPTPVDQADAQELTAPIDKNAPFA